MKAAEDYLNEVLAAMGAELSDEGEISWRYTYEETVEGARLARKEIVNDQKALRLIKRSVNADMKEIRQHYQARSGQAQAGTFTTLFLGRRAAASDRARKKEAMRAERDATLAPYEQVKANIDTLLLELDRTKVKLDTFIKDNS